MKVPDSVIIKQLQEEVKALRRKNHAICEKAKKREEQRFFTVYMLESALDLELM